MSIQRWSLRRVGLWAPAPSCCSWGRGALPVGWSLGNVAVNDGRTEISLTTRTTAPEANRAEVTASADGVLGFTSRQMLVQALRQRSGGRLRLDPSRR